MARDLPFVKNAGTGGMRAAAMAAALWMAACSGPSFAHGTQTHAQSAIAESTAVSDSLPVPPDSGSVGIDEKLGNMVPLDLAFVTEAGTPILLKDLVTRPTILSMVYYRCPNVCNILLASIANVARTYADRPADAPNVITVTVDEKETTADALKAHAMAFEMIQKPYPPERWHFLTGAGENIRRLADAVGFRFARRSGEIEHPMAIIILSPQGKVVRYIMGTDYLPLDISMSLLEASSGTVQPTIARVLRYCFRYDPASHRFVFRILHVTATVVLILVGIFVVYLVVSGRKRRARAAPR